MSRADALARDAVDPLAGFRDRYVLDDGDRIYVDGNSLGRLPLAGRAAIAATTEEWGRELVGGWSRWIDAPLRAGDEIASVIGARPGEVIVCDSVTVNLYKLAWAALDVREGGIVVHRDDFPTDRYVLAGVAAARDRSLTVPGPVRAPTALVCRSLVDFRSGELLDGPSVTAEAHAAGALMLWDLCHAAGAVPVELEAWGADLAVGCTYKYLNAGPGAPAFLYVRHELQERLRSPIQGWFGQADQFAMGPQYRAGAGDRPLPGRDAGDHRRRRGAGGRGRGGGGRDRAAAGQVDRADRAGDHPSRRAAGTASASSWARRASRPAGAPTSPSATPTPGASARR